METKQPPTASAMDRLPEIVQQLSLARTIDEIVDIVRRAARQLTGADGATFVLREREAGEDVCSYVDEDAIGPLWKGRRFPASTCISGWAMAHREAVAIEDVFSDPRIPVDAYSPTFVKSLVVVPIRRAAPVGAIGTYWATRHVASAEEIRVLQALADSTSVAMQSVELHAEIERMAARTADLAAAREELRRTNEALLELGRRKDELAALVAHDIKNPASGLMLRAQMRLREGEMAESERRAWTSVYTCAEAVTRLAMDLVDVSSSERGALELACGSVEVDALAEQLERLMRPLAEARNQRLALRTDARCAVLADRDLLLRVLVNLVENALTHNPPGGSVRLDVRPDSDEIVLAVCDEGPGVPVDQRERVFDKFVRLDGAQAPRTGRGLGLPFCRLAIRAHGGRIWIEDNAPRGSRFCVSLRRAPPA